ncbi:MAG TPA: FRG domain-containing protein [Methylomirabilota bacterium]|nr:FRG domain-containing protein [Methylomirabilota bacterium]
MFAEKEVSSLGEFIDLVTPTERDPVSGRYRDSTVYRGAPHPEYKLLTGLDRLGGITPPHTKQHLEEHVLRNFLRYAKPFLSATANTWEVMVMAQHHGLPTRLLDWTYSPMIAAHFATLRETGNQDRVIWKLDWKRVHERFGLKPLAFLVSDLDEALTQKGCRSAEALYDRDADEDPFVCMLEPPALDARILAQSAAFTLCSTKSRSLDEVLVEHGLADCLKRYIIPARLVSRFRDQLDLCTMTERRLFPDLDGIAAEIRRYYSATPLTETEPEEP